jgi:hypothetical protein
MKRTLACFILILSVFHLQSCRKSVLSELEIESTESFKVKVKIEEKTNKRKWIQVVVRDKTNHVIEFSDGGVFINDNPTEFMSKTVVTVSRGYVYKVPSNMDEFEVTIQWNSTDAYTFSINENAGFPGFSNYIGYNWTQGAEEFVISPAPFADGKISVEYDILK